MTSLRWTPLLAACLAAAGSVAIAQPPPTRRELVGIVKDPGGAGIEGATVEIRGASVGTNTKGSFQLWTGNIDTLTISIRRLGYSPVSAQIAARGGQWDTVVVEMERTSQQLSALVITADNARRAVGVRGFEARRAIGSGMFVARDEIVARNTERLSDVLSNKRGMRVVRVRTGVSGVRFVSFGHTKPNCAPNIWVDGMWVKELEVDEIPASDIEAVEIYETLGSIPFEFTPRNTEIPCGTIVIWTRIPGAP